MYQIHTCKAVVLDSQPQREHDAMVVLFTREIGKVYANAKGIKKIGAKHAMAVQPFQVVEVDMVRGNGGWRLIGSQALDRSLVLEAPFEVRAAYGRVVRVVLDITPIEQVESGLYDLLWSMATRSIPVQTSSSLRVMEAKLLARVLETLGWWSREDVSEALKPGGDIKQFIDNVNQSLAAAYD